MKCILLFCFCLVTLHAKIYDCFTFFNELELLEVRFSELYDHVDKFVLVESVETFRGSPKPLYYEENKERFRKFTDKIIHVVVRERIDTSNPWERENFQRQQIMRGLAESQPEDVIIVSDLDEIVSSASISAILQKVSSETIVGLSLKWYIGYLNMQSEQNWLKSFATTYAHLVQNNVNLSQARLTHKNAILENAGWHFSWMGGREKVAQKLHSYSHQEHDNPYHKALYVLDQHRDYNCKRVTVDASYPRYILDHTFQGWMYDQEEAGHLRYQVGEYYVTMNEWDKALFWYLEAYQANPMNLDALAKIATSYRYSGKHHLALMFAKLSSEIAAPKDYRFTNEIAISAYYAGLKEEGLNAVNALILQEAVPKYMRDQAYNNLQFYVKLLKNARYMPMACFSIQKTEEGYQVITLKNQLLHLDRNFRLVSQKEIVENLPRDRIHIAYTDAEGPEECRLYATNWFSCSISDTHPSGIPKIAICELNKSAHVKKLIPIKGPNPRHAERNWLPFMKNGKLHFIYSLNPFVLYLYEAGECKTVVHYASEYAFQGVAGPIAFDDGYLILAEDGGYHRFVYLDQNFLMKRTSLPFAFENKKRSSGMTIDHSGKEIILAVGDALCIIDLSTVRSLLTYKL